MIQIEDISLQFGDRVLYDEVNLTLSKKYRYILVGANGTGKSTFLSLLTGKIEPTFGSITHSKSMHIGWMQQRLHIYDEVPIIDVVMQGREPLWKALEAKNKLLAHPKWGEKETKQLEKLEEKITLLDGYRAQADAETILMGLGIALEKHQEPLKQFSGGWKMRVLLAQLLFTSPDILLLDEPTNYLDIVSIHWLENYLLQSFSGMVLVVSHDQRFLEAIGTCVLDIDYGQILSYPGTYLQFLKKKEEIEIQKKKEFANIENRVKKMQSFVDRFRSKASKAKQAASRVKMIEKIKWPEIGRSSRVSPAFQFLQEKSSGQIPIKTQGVCKIYDPDIFIGPLTIEIQRGERIAFIGKNGGGKTTLMKLLSEELTPDEGTIQMGHNVKIAIFHQEHKHLFTGEETTLTWLENNAPPASIEKYRQVLGKLLFHAQDIKKKIKMLSGGEMARLLLAKVMLMHANVLMLDEPTNHLDLESKQALGNALKQFPGTVIFVSHDRYFINQVCTRALEIDRESIFDAQEY